MAAFNPAWVIQGIKALTELYALIKAKKVDQKQLIDVGDHILEIVEQVKAVKKSK